MTVTVIADWAARHGVPPAALAELVALLVAPAVPGPPPARMRTEADVQAHARGAGYSQGYRLWRNNVGALVDSRGVPVRYGLANDTPALNSSIKSGDLIGWQSVLIQPEHVGQRLAQFVSVECKAPGWPGVRPGNAREQAQARWALLVRAAGGQAHFVAGAWPALARAGDSG